MSCTFNCDQGRRCTCGLYHAPGGVRVDRGWESDHCEDETEELRCSNVLASLVLVGAGIGVVLALIFTGLYLYAR